MNFSLANKAARHNGKIHTVLRQADYEVDWSTPKWDYVNPEQDVKADLAETKIYVDPPPGAAGGGHTPSTGPCPNTSARPNRITDTFGRSGTRL